MFDPVLPDADYVLIRKQINYKYHGGPRLTRAEKRRMKRIDEQNWKSFRDYMIGWMLIGVPLLWFVMDKLH